LSAILCFYSGDRHEPSEINDPVRCERIRLPECAAAERLGGVKLLVLGGTVFLGRAVAAHARDAGHDVTCAARGKSGAVPDGVRLVHVDRDDPTTLAALDGYDAVVDVARRPSHVRNALSVLAGRTGHWTFVSSGSVYADTVTPGQRVDTAPVLPAAPADVDDAEGENYGPCKVTCEEAVLAAGVPSFLCRAGLIVGPEDLFNRFDYWVSRVERAGEILAPGKPDDLVQWIDVRDLAAWIVRAAETGLTGVYDGTGQPVTRSEFLHGIGAVPSLTWVDQDFLAAQGIQPWAGERSLPMWLPVPEYAGFMSRDVSPSLAAGLVSRPLDQTVRDTLAWLATGPQRTPRAGISPADEAAVLKAWHSRLPG
jgi:2'-hydroxyisoflavone reductase